MLGKSLVRGGVADALKSKSVTPPNPLLPSPLSTPHLPLAMSNVNA